MLSRTYLSALVVSILSIAIVNVSALPVFLDGDIKVSESGREVKASEGGQQ